MIKILILGVVIASCSGGKVSFITPCALSDEDCLISSSQAALPYIADGVPDLGISPVDPLVLGDVKSDDGQLNLKFKNLKITRLKQCMFLIMQVAGDRSTLNFDVECPITATGQYSVAGKLLVVDVDGNGDFEIKTDKIKLSIEAHMETVDGHWHVTDVIHSYEPIEQIHYKLDNLFGGDEEKSKSVHEILNHSWKEVILSIGKPIIEEIVEKAKDHINTFFSVVPAEELFVV